MTQGRVRHHCARTDRNDRTHSAVLQWRGATFFPICSADITPAGPRPRPHELTGSGTSSLRWRFLGPRGRNRSFFSQKEKANNLKETTQRLFFTAVRASVWRSFPSRMTRGAREIMFHVMALRAKSGYVLQQLNGFSRMSGSRKKKGRWVVVVGGVGVYLLHVWREAEWLFPLCSVSATHRLC